MTTPQLMRLPNGTWIRPDTVVAVLSADAHNGEYRSVYGMYKAKPIPPRVIVRYLPQRSVCQVEFIYCESFMAAKTLADELAAQFNARK